MRRWRHCCLVRFNSTKFLSCLLYLTHFCSIMCKGSIPRIVHILHVRTVALCDRVQLKETCVEITLDCFSDTEPRPL